MIFQYAGMASGPGGRSVLRLALYFVLASVCVAGNAQTVRSFSERAGFEVRGDIWLVGNALVTCEASTTCSDIQDGTSAGNNNRPMVYINVDAGAGFDNSSMAELQLPAGGNVLFAGLYWGGRADPSDPDRESIQLRVPGAADYQTVSADVIDVITSQGEATTRPYQALADITGEVASAGNGEYYVGDLTASLGEDGLGFYGGWSLIVIQEHPDEPLRRLSVYDGAVNVSGTTQESVTVSDLLTPLSGGFETFLGALVWEGDQSITGDSFNLEGQDLSDVLNDVDNFWNSNITRLGVRLTDKDPDYVNQLAVDINYVDASGILANGATDAEITFATDGDAYFPHALAFAVDLHAPDLVSSFSKTAIDVNGPPLLPGDEIEYVLSFDNTGQDGADDVVVIDPIPTGTAYVSGSLEILSNAPGGPTGALSDAAGDDVAEYDGPNDEVVFRLGAGADATNGGLIGAGESATFRFRVVLDSDPALYGQTISNEASVQHVSQTLPDTEFEGTTGADVTVGNPALTLDKVATDGSPYSAVGDVIVYELTATNSGDVSLSDVAIDDPLLGGLNCTPLQPAELAPGETLVCTGEYTVSQADIDAGQVDNSATAAGEAANGDVIEAGDTATVLGPPPAPGLTVTKSAAAVPAPVVAGSVISYTVSAVNTGNITLGNVMVSDPLLAPDSVVCATLAPGDSCDLNGDYTLTQADIDAGEVVNTGTGDSDETGPEEDTVTTGLPQEPGLVLDKQAGSAGPVEAGDVIDYTIVATNVGNVTLFGALVDDPMIPLSCNPATPVDLAPGESTECSGSYTVTQGDVEGNEPLVNVATASGETLQGDPVEDSDDASVSVTAGSPAIQLIKEANTAGPVMSGDTIDYSLVATNNGNVTLEDVVIEDDMITLDCSTQMPATLEPGDTLVCTGEYVVQADDLGQDVINTAQVSGSTPVGNVVDAEDSAVTPAFGSVSFAVPSIGLPGVVLLALMVLLMAGWIVRPIR